mgnify:CR=1 FL=1
MVIHVIPRLRKGIHFTLFESLIVFRNQKLHRRSNNELGDDSRCSWVYDHFRPDESSYVRSWEEWWLILIKTPWLVLKKASTPVISITMEPPRAHTQLSPRDLCIQIDHHIPSCILLNAVAFWCCGRIRQKRKFWEPSERWRASSIPWATSPSTPPISADMDYRLPLSWDQPCPYGIHM